MKTEGDATSVESIGEPWKYFGNDKGYVPALFDKTFRDYRHEIEDAYRGLVVSMKDVGKSLKYDYSKSLVVVLKKDDGEILSALIAVHHTASNVFEIVWMATKRSHRCKGFGSLLFDRCQRLALCLKARAVAVAATLVSFPFWVGLEPLRSGHVVRDVMTAKSMEYFEQNPDITSAHKKRLRHFVRGRRLRLSGDSNVRTSVRPFYRRNEIDSASPSFCGAPPFRRPSTWSCHIFFVLPAFDPAYVLRPLSI